MCREMSLPLRNAYRIARPGRKYVSPDPSAATSHFPQGANVFCTDLHLKDIMQNFSKLLLPLVHGFGIKTFLGIGPEFNKHTSHSQSLCISFNFIISLHCIYLDNRYIIKCLLNSHNLKVVITLFAHYFCCK